MRLPCLPFSRVGRETVLFSAVFAAARPTFSVYLVSLNETTYSGFPPSTAPRRTSTSRKNHSTGQQKQTLPSVESVVIRTFSLSVPIGFDIPYETRTIPARRRTRPGPIRVRYGFPAARRKKDLTFPHKALIMISIAGVMELADIRDLKSSLFFGSKNAGNR